MLAHECDFTESDREILGGGERLRGPSGGGGSDGWRRNPDGRRSSKAEASSRTGPYPLPLSPPLFSSLRSGLPPYLLLLLVLMNRRRDQLVDNWPENVTRGVQLDRELRSRRAGKMVAAKRTVSTAPLPVGTSSRRRRCVSPKAQDYWMGWMGRAPWQARPHNSNGYRRNIRRSLRTLTEDDGADPIISPLFFRTKTQKKQRTDRPFNGTSHQLPTRHTPIGCVSDCPSLASFPPTS